MISQGYGVDKASLATDLTLVLSLRRGSANLLVILPVILRGQLLITLRADNGSFNVRISWSSLLFLHVR